MSIVNPTQTGPNAEITSASVNTPVNELASVINGQIDDSNISQINGSKVAVGTLPYNRINPHDTGWLDATLQSGWTGSLKCRELNGVVYITGELTNASFSNTIYTNVATLPVGVSAPTYSVYESYSRANMSNEPTNIRLLTGSNFQIRRDGATALSIPFNMTYAVW